MNFLKLTKRSLVTTKSFSKSKNYSKSSVSVHSVPPFFTKKGTDFYNIFATPSESRTSWRENLKLSVLSLWSSVRIRVLPASWLVQNTIKFLIVRILDIVLPFLWLMRAMIRLVAIRTLALLGHLRSHVNVLISRIKAVFVPILMPLYASSGRFVARVTTNLQPVLKPISNTSRLLTYHVKTSLIPALAPIRNASGKLSARIKTALLPVSTPINKASGFLTSRIELTLMPVLDDTHNKLISSAPSVKQDFKARRRTFFSYFESTRTLSKREAMVSNLISVAIVTACTVLYVNKKETPVQNQVKYGFSFRDFNVIEGKIKEGDIVYSMLVKSGLTHHQTDSLLNVIKPRFDFEKIQDGKSYTTFMNKDTPTHTLYLVFEPDPKRYFIFDLSAPSVKEVKRDVSVREFETSGKLHKTLYSSLVESGLSYRLIGMVQEALKDKMDIKQCENGDEYKLIWEEEIADGHSVGVQKLTGIYVKGQCIPKPVYAFYFNNGKTRGWYEKDNLPVRDGFIDTPVVNSTITSRFNPHRLHPILGYRRPHLGTDFAAPNGTPIMSVADGVIEEAKYSIGGNGRYVKIKHKTPYETQYLHMSRFAEGIEPGTTVKQKQVIGYVGSSGLATGPHVCFRFWKQGTAIDHLAEHFFTTKDSLEFKQLVNEKIAQLNKITVLTDEEKHRQKEYLAQLHNNP